MNPVRKDVRKFALSIVREIVKNYDVDAYALDYCRYPGDDSDFSIDSQKAFERYLGKKIQNFPDDIFTWNTDGTKNQASIIKNGGHFGLMLLQAL